jgi:hypothetical protein
MSNATWTALVCAALIAACASAGAPTQQQPDAAGVTPHHDDANHVTSDAPSVKMDASVPMVDAFMPHDAPATPVDSAIFCTANSQCTNSGECCIILGSPPGICGPGVLIGSTCIPN